MADEHILVVDDEPDIRRLLGRLLQHEGYAVEMVGDGEAAVSRLKEQLFDICICDLRLPGIGGIDVLREAKRLTPDCEVIILTGFGNLESAIEAIRLGAYEYLLKPINDLQVVRHTVHRALEQQRMARRNEQLFEDLERANRELELRRHQQLSYISHIGRALSAALQPQEVARVLVQAMLEFIGCEGAGVLLLDCPGDTGAQAIVGGAKALSGDAVERLLETMRVSLPEPVRPGPEDVHVVHLESRDSEPADDLLWGYESFPLSVRDDLKGVAVLARDETVPFDEDALELFNILSTQSSIALENAALFARANELATRDGITGLYNHRHFFELLNAEISRSERRGEQLAVLMLDIDRQGTGLKWVNDTMGHTAGDELLRRLGQFLVDSVRREDVVARYGGDEFIILAPQTGREAAHVLARRLCEGLHSTPITVRDRAVYITVSMGVAVFTPGCGEDSTTVVNRADREMYQAKHNGGDRVYLASLPAS